MRTGIRISSLVPTGLVIETVSDSCDSIILVVRSENGMAECPLCGATSRRIQRWPRKSGQDDRWSFCLTAGTLCPANQERPCKDGLLLKRNAFSLVHILSF